MDWHNIVVAAGQEPARVNMDGSTNYFDFAARDVVNPGTLPGAVAYGVVLIIAAWLIGRALRLAVHRVLARPKHIASDPTAIRFLGQLARLGVYLFALLTYVHLVPALHSLGTAWLASVGVVSVVFGLAAQNTLGNLVAGISLLLYRPFNIGDRMQVTAPTGLESGVVESLNLGYTVLRTPDNRRVVIPNSAMAGQTSINLTAGGGRLICSVPVTIAAEADANRARTVLAELAKQHPKTREYLGCPVTAVGNATTTLTLKVVCDDFQDAADLKSNLLEAVQKRFKAEGIELR